MRTLIVLLLASCAACSTGATTSPQAAPPTPSTPSTQAVAPGEQGGTLAQIRAMVGTPSCSSDTQCHTLPLGNRPCGGPEGYLAWSSAHTPEAQLRSLGERYKEERRAANTASGAMSTCRFMPDPGAVCRAGTCQLGEGGGASAR